MKKRDKKNSKSSKVLEVNEPTVSSSGVEDTPGDTGDTGSDSGADTSQQKPLKVIFFKFGRRWDLARRVPEYFLAC